LKSSKEKLGNLRGSAEENKSWVCSPELADFKTISQKLKIQALEYLVNGTEHF
jgi:hypothetical protein